MPFWFQDLEPPSSLSPPEFAFQLSVAEVDHGRPAMRTGRGTRGPFELSHDLSHLVHVQRLARPHRRVAGDGGEGTLARSRWLDKAAQLVQHFAGGLLRATSTPQTGHGADQTASVPERLEIKPELSKQIRVVLESPHLFGRDLQRRRLEQGLAGDGPAAHLFLKAVEEDALVGCMLVDHVQAVRSFRDDEGFVRLTKDAKHRHRGVRDGKRRLAGTVKYGLLDGRLSVGLKGDAGLLAVLQPARLESHVQKRARYRSVEHAVNFSVS